jgi:hypothetical protein
MSVVLTSPAYSKQPGETYTGTAREEAWLLAEGYADQAGYEANVAAKLVGGSNAVNVVTGGNLVVQVGNQVFTVALASADTPAAAATKIDTALAGKADAAIVSSKLEVTSNATGYDALITVQGGTGTVLANLGLTSGQQARGNDGGAGVSNTGPTTSPVASNPSVDATRGPIATKGGTPEAGTNTGVATKAYPAPTTHYVGPLA